MKITPEFREELTDLLEEFLLVLDEREDEKEAMMSPQEYEACVRMTNRIENAIDRLLHIAEVKKCGK